MFKISRDHEDNQKAGQRRWVQGGLMAAGGLALLSVVAIGVWSSQQDGQGAGEVLTAAALDAEDAELAEFVGAGSRQTVSRSQAERSTDVVEILEPSSVTLNLHGDVTTTETLATSVRELLLEHDVVLGVNDVVSVSLDAEVTDGMQISVLEGEITHVLEEQTVAFAKQERNDSSMTKGTTKVVQEGRDGKKQVTYQVVTAGGEEVSKTVISEMTVAQAQPQITAIGTAQQVAAPAPSGGGGGSSSVGGGADGLNWAALAQCESGGRVSVVSANGLYHGLYQFSVPTWQSVGGSGLPSQASAEEQLLRAKILYNRSGAGQWPTCGSRLFS